MTEPTDGNGRTRDQYLQQQRVCERCYRRATTVIGARAIGAAAWLALCWACDQGGRRLKGVGGIEIPGESAGGRPLRS